MRIPSIRPSRIASAIAAIGLTVQPSKPPPHLLGILPGSVV